MGDKLQGSGRGNAPQRDTDTTAYQQPWGNSEKGVENQRLPRMPHERDESARATGNRLDESPAPSEKQISRAVDDLDSGRVDTDRRGVPDDVPAPRGGKKR